MPVIGSDFVDRKLELSTAQAITPGQGQEVAIAGVKVGEVGSVDLKDGRAVVTMKIHRGDATLYNNATALVRPKTGLNDMTSSTPARPTPARRPRLGHPDQPDGADGQRGRDPRVAGPRHARVPAAAAGRRGRGPEGQREQPRQHVPRFEPTSRDVLEITRLLAERRDNIKRSIHNFRLLTEAVATKDDELAQLVDSSNAVFQVFNNQDRALRATLNSCRRRQRRDTNLARPTGWPGRSGRRCRR